MVKLWYGWVTETEKKLGALDLQGLRKCGKQDLKTGLLLNASNPCAICIKYITR